MGRPSRVKVSVDAVRSDPGADVDTILDKRTRGQVSLRPRHESACTSAVARIAARCPALEMTGLTVSVLQPDKTYGHLPADSAGRAPSRFEAFAAAESYPQTKEWKL
jgi:hypothetical protein